MPLILSDPFLQRDQDVVPLGALVPPFTAATEIQEENSAAIPCPGLVGAQGTHGIRAGEGTNPQIPWNPLCFPALLEAWVTCVTLLAPDTPCMMRRDRSCWE